MKCGRKATTTLSKRGRLRLSVLVIASLSPGIPALPAQDRRGELLRRYHTEDNPVGKAKFFPRLGDAYIELLAKQTKAEDFDQAAAILEEYVGTMKKLHAELRSAVPDPEKEPDGFKQLQIHLRQVIRRLDDVIAMAPLDKREPLEAGCRELERVNEELVKDLFPRQPRHRTR